MGRHCSVCEHDNREAIDSSLIQGEPLRSIAGRHGLSSTALHRHKRTHLPEALIKAQEAKEIVRGDTLLEETGALIEQGRRILAEAWAAGDHRTALNAIREIRGCLGLLGKITGQLDGPQTVRDPQPLFKLPDGSYPRITVEGVHDNKTIDITPESPPGD